MRRKAVIISSTCQKITPALALMLTVTGSNVKENNMLIILKWDAFRMVKIIDVTPIPKHGIRNARIHAQYLFVVFPRLKNDCFSMLHSKIGG